VYLHSAAPGSSASYGLLSYVRSHVLLPVQKDPQQCAACLQESDLDAECARKQADSEVQRAKAAARAAAAAKMVREQKLQPHHQVL
jgi:hypothetical protein